MIEESSICLRVTVYCFNLLWSFGAVLVYRKMYIASVKKET